MIFSNKQKALSITLLITGTLVLAMFNFQIIKQKNSIAETFYEIEPAEEPLEELTEEQLIEQERQSSKAETNQAFNQNQKNQVFAQAYTRIKPPEDYVRPDLSNADYGLKSPVEVDEKESHIPKDELNAFNKVNAVLKKQLTEASNNAKSTVSYSLVNRKHIHLPIPIYLCEASGKIVISITVNASGKVTDASYNKSSSSTNQCLVDSALEYAKLARFNKTFKKDQLGTITFYFEGK